MTINLVYLIFIFIHGKLLNFLECGSNFGPFSHRTFILPARVINTHE